MKIKNLKFQINRIYGFRPAQIILLPLILIFVVLIFSASIFSRLGIFIKSGSQSVINDQAIVLADGGVDYAIRQVNLNPDFGTPSPPPLSILNGTTPFGTIELQITGTGYNRNVVSTACIPTCTNPRAKRKVSVKITRETAEIPFPYVVFGMQDSGTAVTLPSGSSITGTVHSDSAVSCAGAAVTGTVEYVLGSVPSCGSPLSSTIQLDPMTSTDIQKWRTAADNGGSSSTTCTWDTIMTTGPLKYLCSVTILENAQIALTGPIHITGDLTVTATSVIPRLYIDPALGTCGTVIVVDGKVIMNNALKIEAGGSPPLIITEFTGLDDAIKINGLSSSPVKGIFYAPKGNITTAGSPNVTGVVAGLTVNLPAITLNNGGISSPPPKFCGLTDGFVVDRGTYKISK